MKLPRIKKMFATGLLALALGLFPSKVQSQQLQRIRVVDPITQEGLPNWYAILKNNVTQHTDTFRTNAQGYVDITTSVDENENEQQLEARVFQYNNGVRFDNASRVKIYDLLGKEVQSIENTENLEGGNLFWNLKNKHGDKVSAGFYIYDIVSKNSGFRGKLIYNGESIFPGKTLTRIAKDKSKNILNKVLTNEYTLELKDELTNNVGEYYDMKQSAGSVSGFKGSGWYGTDVNNNYFGDTSKVYEALYNLEIDLPEGFRSYFTRSIATAQDLNNNDIISVNWLDNRKYPFKIFHNRNTAPLPVFNQALDDVLQMITDSTTITHRGQVAPGIQFQEVPGFINNGINMDYTSAINATIPIMFDPPPGLNRGVPAYMTVKIDRNQTDYWDIRRDVEHEFGAHVLTGAGFFEPVPYFEFIPNGQFKTLLTAYKLKNFANLSLCQEE